ncbi:putative hemolysin [Kutzneria viridogrisea]|uniref:Hemolysin n=1 Tax=Kutzneria viridogrisea TaxID=47990 RepID=A0ABR6BS46_9PSEU|nr:putative hemolysin [Kutzneria viridogrisea]
MGKFAGSAPIQEVERYTVRVADDAETVRQAQRLRYEVFTAELGVRLGTPVPGLDLDPFDEFCDHLVVQATTTGTVVGTYRLLRPGRTARLYSDSEFDLSALHGIRPDLVEAGRSCVHPDHRTGAVINLLWAALARYVLLSGHRHLAGCASVPLRHGPEAATATWALAEAKHLSPQGMRVRPHTPWTPPTVHTGLTSAALVPPLLRGYLRLGAWVCGPPAHDPEFGTADLFVLLDLERINPRYLDHFLGADR